MDFEMVYETYYDRIYRYVYSILLNHAYTEDVVSDTFFAALSAYPGYDPSKASHATWLTGIAHNKAVNLVRSAAYRKNETLSGREEMPGEKDFTESAQAKETLERLYERLKVEERELLNLRYVMELKDAEIAGLYDIPVKTINKRYQRLLKKCRGILEE